MLNLMVEWKTFTLVGNQQGKKMNIIKILSVFSVLCFSPTMTTELPAQILKTLHNFHGGDGSYPMASVALSSNTLFGTTSRGGPASRGAVFALRTDGSSA